MKVIGAGLPRTGTATLKAALDRLGLGPCYHMSEVMAHHEHADRWVSVNSGEPVDWDRVLDGYRSCVDWPASGFWRELAAAYPEAKVVLTVRDPHRWFASFHELLGEGGLPSLTAETAPEPARPLLATMERIRPLLDRIAKATFGPDFSAGTHFDEDETVAAFQRHTETVREALPAERLLVFDVRAGWGPLCDFLGVPPPADPFPHLNESAALRQGLERLMTEGRSPLPFDG
jgi:hypothetical protein